MSLVIVAINKTMDFIICKIYYLQELFTTAE